MGESFYNAKRAFEVWLPHGGSITDNKALIDYFMDGLTRKLLEKIHLMQNMPTTIDEWYKSAAQLYGQYRCAQAIANQSRNSYTPDYAPPRRVTSIKDPNAMDIDAVMIPRGS